jgi:hypothetical protein
MNKELQVLKRMRELLAAGWTQGAMARNKNGKPANLRASNAVCFCLIGSQCRAEHEFGFVVAGTGHLLELRTGTSAFNDAEGRTQAEILAVVDAAIAKREAA